MNGRQLGLGELMFTETAPVGRQNGSNYIKSHTGKGQESDLWHPTPCLLANSNPEEVGYVEFHQSCEDVNRAG